jgi:protein-L-isoaspartate(D-aspartate) O-methyltransferase
MSDDLTLERQKEELLRVLQREGIHDPRTLDAIDKIPRELFIPAESRESSYENRALPIGRGQTISQPYIVALMTQELRLTGVERVLEIGTGSGYQTAILATLADTVYSIERIKQLSFTAEVLLDRLGFHNVHFRLGDGTEGWPEEAPFDRILVTAAGPRVPRPLLDQLADGGILIMPIGDAECQSLDAHYRQGDRYSISRLCSCRFVPLIGVEGWAESQEK